MVFAKISHEHKKKTHTHKESINYFFVIILFLNNKMVRCKLIFVSLFFVIIAWQIAVHFFFVFKDKPCFFLLIGKISFFIE
jgi:hypothetical protein